MARSKIAVFIDVENLTSSVKQKGPSVSRSTWENIAQQRLPQETA